MARIYTPGLGDVDPTEQPPDRRPEPTQGVRDREGGYVSLQAPQGKKRTCTKTMWCLAWVLLGVSASSRGAEMIIQRVMENYMRNK